MYILKNALVSIKRNKGRNILIAIIVMVIAAAVSVNLAIMSSSNAIIDSYAEKYKIEATIGMDRFSLMDQLKNKEDSDEQATQEEMIEAFNNIESLTEDEINNYGDSEYVKDYYYTYKLGMDAKDLTEATDSLVKETTTTETTEKKEQFAPPSGFRGEGGFSGTNTITTKKTTKVEKIYNEKAQNGAFSLIGYSSFNAMNEFVEGSYTISLGQVDSDFTSNSCVISSELADLNELSVGDTITLVNPNDENLTYELIISGIFQEKSDSASDMSNMFSSSANMILTNDTIVKKILEDDENLSATLNPTYIIKDQDSVDLFKEEVIEKGLANYYTVTDNLSVVTEATKSVSNIKKFATTFLVITLIIGVVVLLVINMINIRERKYEIGVLRTIGMKKSKVIMQFVIELLVVSVIGLSIGAGIGEASSVNIANNLLANEIENSNEEKENINQNFGGSMNRDNEKIQGVAEIEEVHEIQAVVDMKVLGELLFIGLGITILSSVSSMVAIARFSPLTILKERS